jgi:hypothetical protein
MEENFQESVKADQTAKTATKEKMPVIGHILCGWPLLLVAIGGAIGGGLGGAAYAINAGIYKSNLPIPAKVVLNIIVGSAAIVIWYSIAMALRS